MVDDVELLQRYAAEKSEAAFAALVERHLDLVYSAALRRLGGDAHSAADVAQQVFVRLARQAASLATGVVLPAWLYAATRNVTVDHVRGEQRRRAREKEAQMQQELERNENAGAEWEQLRPLLDAAMDELGERDRAAVLLRYFARRSFAEIGRALATSEDAARMRVDRALEKLRGLLARRGVSSTAAALGLVLSSRSAAAAPTALAPAIAGAAWHASSATLGPMTTALQFMGTSKMVTGGAVLLALLAIGTALHEVRASRAAGETAIMARRENTALDLRARALGEAASQAEAELAAWEAAMKPGAGLAPPPVRRTSSAPPDFSAAHPAVRRAWVEYSRARMANQVRPLFRELNLTPGQIAEFTRIAVQGGSMSNWTGPDGKPVTLSAGGDANGKAAALRTLLGEEGYRRYEETERQSRARALTSDVAGSLYATAAPLSPGQGAQLTRVLYESGLVSDRRVGTLDWAAAIEKSRAFLSGPQLAALQSFEGEQEYQQLYIQLMQRAVKEGWPPGGTK